MSIRECVDFLFCNEFSIAINITSSGIKNLVSSNSISHCSLSPTHTLASLVNINLLSNNAPPNHFTFPYHCAIIILLQNGFPPFRFRCSSIKIVDFCDNIFGSSGKLTFIVTNKSIIYDRVISLLIPFCMANQLILTAQNVYLLTPNPPGKSPQNIQKEGRWRREMSPLSPLICHQLFPNFIN